MILWHENKRQINLRKHGIDLADLEPVFDQPMLTVEDQRAHQSVLNVSPDFAPTLRAVAFSGYRRRTAPCIPSRKDRCATRGKL